MSQCVCGSGKQEANCCLSIIQGKSMAQTAEALMRSRYVAYVKADAAYLLRSWHSSTRPSQLDLSEQVEWLALQINSLQGDTNDTEAWVEFTASYKTNAGFTQLHELSRFVFEQGCWFYVEGEMLASKTPSRNAACPCGSQLKFKRCCGA